MVRNIIKIDKEKCDGCGLCVSACHEGAIGMVDGKAELLRDDYCDGLGNCLPVCPTGAISFEEREAAPYDEAEVLKNAQQNKQQNTRHNDELPCGCPGTHAKVIEREDAAPPRRDEVSSCRESEERGAVGSQLRQWPVQIKLVPVNAPYFNNADLLVAADCAAYAYGSFHGDFMKNKVTLIGCPKLDEGDYSEKLSAILQANNIRSVTVVRMEVPCCGGIENAVITALRNSGKMIPWRVVVIGTDGNIID